jgi:hypothetical protein
MLVTIVWDVTSCILLDIYQHFGGTYGLQCQGKKSTILFSRWGLRAASKRNYLPDYAVSRPRRLS